jgi:hypothetical protein
LDRGGAKLEDLRLTDAHDRRQLGLVRHVRVEDIFGSKATQVPEEVRST